MSVTQRIQELVDGLGSTPDDVATLLATHGIAGLKHDGRFCPVATFLCAELPETAGQWSDLGYFVNGDAVEIPGSEAVELPLSVIDFIKAFDGGRYPDLVRAAEVDE